MKKSFNDTQLSPSSTQKTTKEYYVPKSARINVPFTCSESNKENEKAIALIAKGVQNCSAARIALADAMKKMAQLELEMAIHIWKSDFIHLILSLCEDLVFHTLKNENIGNTTRSIEALAFLCFQSFGVAKLSEDYFMNLLSSKQDDFYNSMVAIAVPNHDPEADSLKTPSITGPKGLAIQRISDILAKFLVTATIDLKTQQASEWKTKEDNAKILARRTTKGQGHRHRY
jgi:hypothetical protein